MADSMMALIPVASSADLEREAELRNSELQAQPMIQGLAAHVRRRWEVSRDAKRELEERMLECLRQRNGDYDPDIEAQINAQGGSDIFVQLTSVKCRAATSWLRDTLLGSGNDKAWSIEPTPEPELPQSIIDELQGELAMQVQQHMMQTGQTPDEETLRRKAMEMRDVTFREYRDESEKRVARMEQRMEDQLIEGNWHKAFNEFIDDVVTFPFACIKGPIKRRRKVMKFVDGTLQPVDIVRNEWERVDPFMLYWAPWAWDINDGYVIERHRMTRDSLQALIGVPGYNEDAIRSVLYDFNGAGYSSDWLWVDSALADAQGKDTLHSNVNEDLIDALQLWDSVEGTILLEWGLSEEEIPDPALSYPCEVWLVGNTVIRAVLNYDPIGRKPYYLTSYEAKPGSVDGKGVADLCRDSQLMVNATARAMANNMGISSGPQVGVNVSRLPPGEDITDLHPWKIWQFESGEYNDGAPPLTFYQPPSNAAELMAVFEKFSERADEDTMIPKYMTGGHQPGAGRTSSGLSMMISNAGKGIKQVINNIDKNVIVPAIERLYQDNLRYNQDPDIVGDVHIVARGANSLVVKEAEAIRRNEFLQLVLNSPVANQIVGNRGTAELLRDAAKNLNINVDKVVPDTSQVSMIDEQQQLIAQLQQQLQMMQESVNAAPDNVEFTRDAQGNVTGATRRKTPVLLPDGSPAGGSDGNTMRNVVTGRNG
jgi:hypothetical protein